MGQVTMVKRFQLAVRLFVLVLFLVWILIWIMMPTNTFTQKWLPRYNAKANSTYLGSKGSILLMYTFPVMLMATLGCVYGHLAKKINDSNVQSCNKQKRELIIWKPPMLTNGPLGIVSATELLFLLMFIALLVWTFAISIHNSFATITAISAATDAGMEQNWFLQSRHQVRLVSARVLPCEAVELNFSKTYGLTYNPTSVMFINVPSISKLQWHPFTITSNSNLEQEKLSVVIKNEGTWTRKLHHLLSTPSTIDRLSVSVEGPYGPVSNNYLRHDTLVMVSGGSGITPFISVVRELIYLKTTFKCETPKLVLICAFRNSSSLSMLDLILSISGNPFNISDLELQIEAYITRDEELKEDVPVHPKTIWFKPNPSDAPIHAILASVASATFVWNKKHIAKEANQTQNMEGSRPSTSPNSMVYNVDSEIESLPYQSLIHATNVHYGVRPDLRKILFEHKGSSVGVLASGPKRMRQEVATICSSGLTGNLHFESISFSW
ncbi:hypothetical protein Fmac_010449 [Flemingia macrophylla]|uniref:ferric-chelate reductase (NADH) n=1 Tax=Flemingia macrophylla TaxID=520843 RepID=A0ABD1MKG4_9FABA